MSTHIEPKRRRGQRAAATFVLCGKERDRTVSVPWSSRKTADCQLCMLVSTTMVKR